MNAGLMVRFNITDEFLAEVEARKPGLVRVTKEYRSLALAVLRAVHVVATFLDRDDRTGQPILIRLDAYCGQTMERDDDADKRAGAIVHQILGGVHQLSVSTAAGIFEYQAS